MSVTLTNYTMLAFLNRKFNNLYLPNQPHPNLAQPANVNPLPTPLLTAFVTSSTHIDNHNDNASQHTFSKQPAANNSRYHQPATNPQMWRIRPQQTTKKTQDTL
jgi:hypothetical protein